MPGRYKDFSKEVVRTERYEIDTGKYGVPPGTTSTVRSTLYTCENTFRSGLEKAVEVYCIRSFRPVCPQAQRPVSFFVCLSAAMPATSARTKSAIQGSRAESDVAAGGNLAPGRSSSVNLPRLVSPEAARKLRKVSHSLTKPLNNGKPTMEQQAIRNMVPVRRIRFSKPPSSSRSSV